MDDQQTHERTGHPEVDAVLAGLEALPDLPVADHVALLDSAHSALRALLAAD